MAYKPTHTHHSIIRTKTVCGCCLFSYFFTRISVLLTLKMREGFYTRKDFRVCDLKSLRKYMSALYHTNNRSVIHVFRTNDVIVLNLKVKKLTTPCFLSTKKVHCILLLSYFSDESQTSHVVSDFVNRQEKTYNTQQFSAVVRIFPQSGVWNCFVAWRKMFLAFFRAVYRCEM